MNLLSVLAEKNIIDKGDIPSIKEDAQESGENIEKVLVRRGIDPDIILRTKGESLNVPIWNLGNKKIPFEMFRYIPEESALHYKFVPLEVKDGVLQVGIIDPDNIEALDALNFISSKVDMPFKAYLISQSDFEEILKMYKGFSGEVTKAISELETEISPDEKVSSTDKKKKLTGTQAIKEDAPVTKIVANAIRFAVEGGASDIHIEPMAESVRVRFRVDGVLRTSLVLPTKIHRAIAARIKVLASLRLDEKRKPQDGRFSTNINDRKIDFRVSTFPSNYGEKVVVRVLDTGKNIWKLDEMGLEERNLKIIQNAIKRPYGLILISGPTGSGKSTTLYAMLNEMDRETKNVLSLEDPVEYNIGGVSQSQVMPEIGYTFANGLRTTLRQDPDIIMVGEIRDKETAQLAVQAALTGHLVLSTIHTNDSLGVIPRLIEMDVDPFLIAPTLVIAVAQRLVRKLCPGAEKPVAVKGSLKLMLEKEFNDMPEKYRKMVPIDKELFNAEPTNECPTGMRGRTAVFEILDMNKEIEEAILTNPSEAAIKKIARANGMFTMKEDAIIKAFNKIIPFSEVNMLGGEMLTLE
ncbi:MAG: GspE/PulE family protein [Candidatus Pacebacteria bacterium]|jgi:type IV pilus assembly protein PilB|nr:GspE/PulE family protein [Candidatus Paceibacterota bacterium]|tara:strand:+ start:30636 stop:32372 length:1737 start_codon:yes stop_codon:yes gene_type:complete